MMQRFTGCHKDKSIIYEMKRVVLQNIPIVPP